MYELNYDSASGEIYKVNLKNMEKELIAEMASEPSYCPNGKRAVFIDPLAWECEGELFLVNLENGNIATLNLDSEEAFTPKFVNWVDDNNFIVIIGYIHGTVSIGGDIYIVNVHDRDCELKLIDKYPDTIQVTAVDILNNGDLIYTGIEYIDDNYNTSIPYRYIKNYNSVKGYLLQEKELLRY